MAQAVTINSVVLLGISDHHTRNQIQKKNKRVVGGLMGKSIGGQLIIKSSFEMAYTLDQSGEIASIDQEHLEKKVKLIQTDDKFNHFKDDEFIGWYSSSPDSQFMKNDLNIHNKVTQSLNKILAGSDDGSAQNTESALYLCIALSPEILANPNIKEVPITLYKPIQKDNQSVFQQQIHQVNAEEGEIISIESASQSTDTKKSQFGEQLQSTLNAVNRYNEKIEGLIANLDNPSIKKNLILMRELKGILNSYPQQIQTSLDQQMIEQYTDANLTSFFSGISALQRVVYDVYSNNPQIKSSSNNQARRPEYF